MAWYFVGPPYLDDLRLQVQLNLGLCLRLAAAHPHLLSAGANPESKQPDVAGTRHLPCKTEI